MGTVSTTFQCVLRGALKGGWVETTGKREGRKDGGRIFARPTKAEKCRLGAHIFTRVFICSPGHTKSAWLGSPASAGYF